MQTLTECQARVLDAIVQMTRENGYCPTYREIGDGLGGRSTSTVLRHIEALERKGYLRRAPGKARRLDLTDKASGRSKVHVLGGMASSFRGMNRITIEGARYPLGKAIGDALPRDGHVVEFDLLCRLGMYDEDDGGIREGWLWFEPAPTTKPAQAGAKER